MRTSPWIKVRNSKIHGKGVFAAKRIPKGTRVIEYLGDRISHAEADARYEDHDPNDNHTFLFIVDKKTVIDAGVKGNAARFNHSCDGNCESVIEQSRVFIETTRVLEAGQELGYDYEIGREKDDPPNVDEIFACRCGSPKCRGTMLWPAKRPAPKKSATKKKATRRGKTATSGKTAASGKTANSGKTAPAGKSARTAKTAPRRRGR
jgi:hypothetical protein